MYTRVLLFLSPVSGGSRLIHAIQGNKKACSSDEEIRSLWGVWPGLFLKQITVAVFKEFRLLLIVPDCPGNREALLPYKGTLIIKLSPSLSIPWQFSFPLQRKRGSMEVWSILPSSLGEGRARRTSGWHAQPQKDSPGEKEKKFLSKYNQYVRLQILWFPFHHTEEDTQRHTCVLWSLRIWMSFFSQKNKETHR